MPRSVPSGRGSAAGPWRRVAVYLGLGMIAGLGLTIAGVLLRDASPHGASVAAESVRNAGIAIVGGVTVGGFVSVVQRAINVDLAARAARADQRHALDLAIATRRDLQTIDLGGADLRRRYLAGKDLSQAELGDADLEDANLHAATLRRAQLVGARLVNANLTDADLTDADLTGADLTGANLAGAVLQGVVADDTTRWPA